MEPLELVKLISLMRRTGGTAQLKVALIDGPVTIDHPDLAGQSIQQVTGKLAAVFATATIALLWSEFPSTSASAVKLAIAGANRPSRRVVVPGDISATVKPSRGQDSSGVTPRGVQRIDDFDPLGKGSIPVQLGGQRCGASALRRSGNYITRKVFPPSSPRL